MTFLPVTEKGTGNLKGQPVLKNTNARPLLSKTDKPCNVPHTLLHLSLRCVRGDSQQPLETRTYYINAPISSLATFLSSGRFSSRTSMINVLSHRQRSICKSAMTSFANLRYRGVMKFLSRSRSSRRNWQKIKSWHFKLPP